MSEAFDLDDDVSEPEGFDMEAAVNEIGAAMFPDSAETDTGTEESESVLVDTLPAETSTDDAAPKEELAPAAVQPVVDPAVGEAPQTWTNPAKAEWSKLPPLVRAEIQKREADMFRGIEQYREKANFGSLVQNQLAPYMGVLQQYRIDPLQQIGAMMAAHHTLALGNPAQKIALFQQFAKDYGVDLAQVAGALGIQVPGGEQIPVNPLQSRLDSVQSRLEAIEREKASQQQAVAQQQQASLRQTIQQFAADPAHEFFPYVVDDIARMYQSGTATSLEQAYEAAIWAKPEIRQYLMARMVPQTTPQQVEVEKAQARQRAAAAQAANVRSRPSGASGTTGPVGTIDETLAEALAASKKRR
jgi:hypothetical protein